jgi:hypothetical protein
LESGPWSVAGQLFWTIDTLPFSMQTPSLRNGSSSYRRVIAASIQRESVHRYATVVSPWAALCYPVSSLQLQSARGIGRSSSTCNKSQRGFSYRSCDSSPCRRACTSSESLTRERVVGIAFVIVQLRSTVGAEGNELVTRQVGSGRMVFVARLGFEALQRS